MLDAGRAGQNALLVAATGAGKTLAGFLPTICELAENPRWLAEDARQNVEGRALADAEGIVASLRRPRPFAVMEAASDLQIPTLFLLADDERSVLVGPARERLRRALPAASRIWEFDSGHTIHRDRFEEYLTAVLEWASER